MTPPPTTAAWLVPTLAVATAVLGVLLVIAVVVLTRARRRREESEWSGLDRDLALAEQTGRLRIVRELQDVAIRQVSALVDAADGARYTAGSDPQAAARSLERIAEQGRVALGDLRRVQHVVREGERVAAPQPGLPSARDLVAVLRDAGLDLDFRESGERFDLNPAAELAVFRILQSALDNALRHGGPGTRVRVLVAWASPGLQMSVDDDGLRSRARSRGLADDELAAATAYSIDDDLRALTRAADGAGLTAMRERAALFGGTLDARPVPGVGFSVQAVFPALRHHNGVHGVDLRR